MNNDFNSFNNYGYQNQNFYNQQSIQFFLVANEDEAKNIQLMPNSKAMLMHTGSNVFWWKTTNAFCQVTMEEYEFNKKVKIEDKGQQFVTYDEFAKLRDSINKLIEEVKHEPVVQ